MKAKFFANDKRNLAFLFFAFLNVVYPHFPALPLYGENVSFKKNLAQSRFFTSH